MTAIMLSPADELALLREKYPDGLYCTSPRPCPHRLLATTRAGYAKSNLTEHQREVFVCASCRQDEAARGAVAAARAEVGRRTIQAAQEARRARLVHTPAVALNRAIAPKIARTDAGPRGIFADAAVVGAESTPFPPGRTPKYRSERARRAGKRRTDREAARAYRARRAMVGSP